MDWRSRLAELLPAFGHRNWIIVGDAAMPAFNNVEVVVTGEPLPDVLAEVLQQIGAAGHVTPLCHLDTELDHLDEDMAPGVGDVRTAIVHLLAGLPVDGDAHDVLLARITEESSEFDIVMFKSNCRVPYTSVFIELGCGYWSAEKEDELRVALE